MQNNIFEDEKLFIFLLKRYEMFYPEELYKVVCIFHPDKNASLQINIPQKFYYCYGCGAKGGSKELYQFMVNNKKDIVITKEIQKVLDYVVENFEHTKTAKNTKITDLEIWEGLAAKFIRSNFPEKSQHFKKRLQQQVSFLFSSFLTSAFSVSNSLFSSCFSNISVNTSCLSLSLSLVKLYSYYTCLCLRRKIKKEIYKERKRKKFDEDLGVKENYKTGIKFARNFYSGLPDPNWFKPGAIKAIAEETQACKSYMRKRGYTANTLKRFGAKPSLNKNYPICFPILENGILRGYVQRTFDPQIEQMRKYMYNKGFKRELILPGSYEPEKPIVLVEGYLDFLKAMQIGVKNCAALLGWKLSEHQMLKIKQKQISVIICALDNDEAGNKGYNYLRRIAKVNGFIVYRLRYPKGCKDMGDIQKGTKAAEMVLKQIQNFERKGC